MHLQASEQHGSPPVGSTGRPGLPQGTQLPAERARSRGLNKSSLSLVLLPAVLSSQHEIYPLLVILPAVTLFAQLFIFDSLHGLSLIIREEPVTVSLAWGGGPHPHGA